jgi:hypothetical protein
MHVCLQCMPTCLLAVHANAHGGIIILHRCAAQLAWTVFCLNKCMQRCSSLSPHTWTRPKLGQSPPQHLLQKQRCEPAQQASRPCSAGRCRQTSRAGSCCDARRHACDMLRMDNADYKIVLHFDSFISRTIQISPFSCLLFCQDPTQTCEPPTLTIASQRRKPGC